jgi:transcriptional regulator with XRE-family HTH domain
VGLVGLVVQGLVKPGQFWPFVNKELHENAILVKFFVMPKSPLALSQMPPAALSGLQQLGSNLAVARLRRKESLASWAQRIGISIPTLMRMEAGEPGVGIGIYATALWLLGRSGSLADLAAPEKDVGALEQDVRAAVALGKARTKQIQTKAAKRIK